MTNRTWVEINRSAVEHNINTLKSLLKPEVRFCAVVKANAYGHGLEEIAQIASNLGIDCFATDTIEDAVFLRSKYPSAMLIVLGHALRSEYMKAIEHNLELTMYDIQDIQELDRIATNLSISVSIHLKAETGTARQGITLKDFPEIVSTLQSCHNVNVSGLSTHFADAENAYDPSFTKQQQNEFQIFQLELAKANCTPKHIHSACSAAILMHPKTHGTLVRAGIAMYGLYSSEQTKQFINTAHPDLKLQPALSWKTRIAQIRPFQKNTTIGYGRSETISKDSRVAVLPVGYWDGYSRSLSSVGEVIVNGKLCKVLGKVCMNMMMVDVTHALNTKVGDEVILIGREGKAEVSAHDIANKADTIHYEIVTNINPMLPRFIN